MPPRALLPVLALWVALLGRTLAQDITPPTIMGLTPGPGSTLPTLTQITVTFSEPVAGVRNTDLLINEIPATAVTGGGATFTFLFSPPPPGAVAVDLDVDTAITDAAGNPLNPGGPNTSWIYTLADLAPPGLASITPAPGATVTSLTQAEVVFTERVAGVDAADLTVNGVPASTVTTMGGDRYLFQFGAPASGGVTFAWTPGHGIQDLAPTPNAFQGGNWTCTLTPGLAPTVVISEILADNLNSLADADGQKVDWIELHNRGSSPVNLLGWSLTDDPAAPGKWTFPDTPMAAGQYLIVFASGKDRQATGPGTTNHASFTLASGGGYLALVRPELPRTVAHGFNRYPEQRADVAYGLVTGTNASHFSLPSPGTANNPTYAVGGFLPTPRASVRSGFFSQPFALTLATETPGAEIRYTLDGSAPGPSNSLYSAALTIAGSPQRGAITLRAAAFKPGLLPSEPLTRTYIFPDHVLMQSTNPPGYPLIWDSPCSVAGINCVDAQADYEMDPQVLTNSANNYGPRARAGLLSLPTLSIVTHTNLLFGPAQGVYVRREAFNQQQVSAELIHPDGSEGFNVLAGLEVVGGTSPNDSGGFWKSRKLSMRLLFSGQFGPTKLRHRVFPDSPVDEFDTLVVDAGSNYYWTYNGGSAADDQRQRATYTRDQYVADLQKAMGRLGPHGRYVHVYLNGLYWGLHCLHERPDHSFSASYFGGDKAAYDCIKHRVGTIVNGYNTNYTAMHALSRSGLATNSVYESLQAMLDLPWFIDYMVLNHYAGNDDWAHQNWYCARVPGFGWRYYSWDAEHSFKGAAYNAVTDLDAGDTPTALFQLLRTNAEFRLLYADHVHRHFFNNGVFSTPALLPLTNDALLAANRPASLFMRRIQEIDSAMVPESARWGDTGETGTSRANNPLTRDREWLTEVNALLGRTNLAGYTTNYFPQRASNVLNQFRAAGVYPSNQPPVFSRHGGTVPSGHALFMTNVSPGTTILFTTNGADPRVYGSSAISGEASTYTGSPVLLTRSTVVKARSLAHGTNWSALNEAAFTVGSLGPALRLVELMFHPPGGDAYEFLEFQNTGVTPLNLGGWTLEGVSFTFPPYFTLAAGARLVLASDQLPAAFAARYPGVQVAGWFGGSLDNGGERVALRDAAGSVVLSVDYDDAEPWPTPADGAGYSLEIIDAQGDPDDPANWRASTLLHGTPGTLGPVPPNPAVVLNELMADNVTAVPHGGGFPDWIELHNPGTGPVDLTGWSLTDHGDPRRFVFPGGTLLAAGAHLVVWCDTNTAAPGLHTGWGLDRNGTGVFLYDPATNRVDGVSLGAQLADYTVGRVAGAWQLTSPTPGAANIATPVAPSSALVLNEWLANAAPGSQDWVEVHNTSSLLPAALRGLYLSSDTTLARLSALSFLRPGGFLQLLADEQPGPAHLDFKLPATGGTLVLSDAGGTEINRATYGPQAEGVSQGRLPDGAANTVSFPGTPSPGSANYRLANQGAVLHEVLARNSSGLFSPWGTRADWIEIANTNASTLSLGGLGLGDSPAGPRWVFPAGVALAGNSQIRVWCDGSQPGSTAAGADLNAPFSLGGESGAVYLFSTNGQVLDFVVYGPQAADLSIGRSGGAWRLLAAPTPGLPNGAPATLGTPAGLRFNEWMSQPARGADWFELHNPANQPVDLGGLHLTDDPSISGTTQFTIAPLSFIGPRGFARFVADGDPGQGRDHVNFALNDLGDTLRLHGTNQALIDGVDFGPLAPGASQGRLPDGGSTVVTFPASATPGSANYAPLPSTVISEVLAQPGTHQEDAVELYNPTPRAALLGGWFLSDSEADLRKFRIPDGTLLAGGAYLVFYATQFNSGAPGSFALDGARGGQVFLSEADALGNLTGFRAQAAFGAAEDGGSLGRALTCDGARFVPLGARSFGQDNPASLAQFRTGAGLPNAAPMTGPLVLNEVHAHPAAGGDPGDEFIEILNPAAIPVALLDPANPGAAWQLQGGVHFRFPTSLTLPAGGFALIVGFDPTADPTAAASFRTRFAVPASVPMLGPWAGSLANEGEPLELTRPGPPVAAPDPGPGYVPSIVVDRLDYAATLPWPAAADGGGASLQRLQASVWGDDAGNWTAAPPTAGLPAPTLPPALPSFTEQPLGRVAATGSRVTFQVSACGTRPFTYQWRKNGSTLPGATNASLILPAVQAADAATYTVVVGNAAGSALSSAAILTLGQPPSITAQPAATNVPPGGTFTLTVGASGTAPLEYQWRRNGLPLPGATNATYSVTNTQPADSGAYSVVVANGVGSAVSANAQVLLAIPPTFLEQPTNLLLRVPPDVLANPTNRVAVFRVSATSLNPPLSFQWRFNGMPLEPGTPHLTGATSNILTLTNVQFAQGGAYDCLLTDAVSAYPSATARLIPVVTPIVIQSTTNSMTNVVNSSVTLSAAIFGSPPPFYFIWRSNSMIVRIIATSQTNDFSTFLTPTNPATISYRVEVTNLTATLINFTNRVYFTNYIVADTDADGLPDYYEAAYGPGGSLSAGGDEDGDGMGNLAEYIAGTDPLDPASFLQVTFTTPAPGAGARLSFGAIANRTYTLQAADRLPAGTGPWSNLVHFVALPTNRVETLLDSASATQRFYRVVTPRQ
ncbi:MAG: hypothetical protein RJA22_1231 [Verrucomicrobiota bacterium]